MIDDIEWLPGFSLSKPLGLAYIGFNREDWESGSKDQWYLAGYTEKNVIDELIQVVNSGKITTSELSVRCLNLYQDEHSLAPIGPRKHLFLQPTLGVARGEIRSLFFSSSKIDISPLETVENLDDKDVLSEPVDVYYDDSAMPASLETPIEPIAESIKKLTASVETLRSSIKWVGFFLVVAVIFAARH